MMVSQMKVWVSAFLFVVLFYPLTHAVAAENTPSLIGGPIINFSLTSTQDRLINYGQEYYGRHNVIITFFPAAYTPI